LKVLDLTCIDANDDSFGAMKGLLCQSALEKLEIWEGGFTGLAISQIKPGQWKQLKRLDLSDTDLSDDPVGAMRELLCLSALQDLYIFKGQLNGDTVRQISHGDWPQLKEQGLSCLYMSGTYMRRADPVRSIKVLLYLTSLTHLDIHYCDLTRQLVSQSNPDKGWPSLIYLNLSGNNLSDDSAEVVKVLLELPALDLDIKCRNFTLEEAKQLVEFGH
jgi:Leucine-rich repeat (LRR) protein